MLPQVDSPLRIPRQFKSDAVLHLTVSRSTQVDPLAVPPSTRYTDKNDIRQPCSITNDKQRVKEPSSRRRARLLWTLDRGQVVVRAVGFPWLPSLLMRTERISPSDFSPWPSNFRGVASCLSCGGRHQRRPDCGTIAPFAFDAVSAGAAHARAGVEAASAGAVLGTILGLRLRLQQTGWLRAEAARPGYAHDDPLCHGRRMAPGQGGPLKPGIAGGQNRVRSLRCALEEE